jgi:hypothetical protein
MAGCQTTLCESSPAFFVHAGAPGFTIDQATEPMGRLTDSPGRDDAAAGPPLEAS